MSKKPIKLIKSSFYNEGDTKRQLVEFILRSDILSMGKETEKFESSFAKKQQRKYAVFVNSGSSANLVLIQALINLKKIRPRASVGISSLTWSTNVMPLIQLGLTPVPIDVSLETLNISPETLMEHIEKIDALFLTNVLGFGDDMVKIQEMCREKNVLLIEDNCEALGSKISGTLLGNFGLASTFSFFVAHHISTIEGGMICTDDEELRHALIIARAHGWDRSLPLEKQKSLRMAHGIDVFFSKYSFYDLAYSVRPTDINAFIGNIQLKYWDTIVEARKNNFKRFQKSIVGNKDLLPLKVSHMDIVSNFAMPLIAKNNEVFMHYKKRFEDNNIEIRPIIAGNITKHPFYLKNTLPKDHGLKNADFIHINGFYFGNNPDLTEEEIVRLESLLSDTL